MKQQLYTTALLEARRASLIGAFAIALVILLQGCAALVPVMFIGGIGTAALTAADRRSAGTILEDETIEWKVADLVRKNFGTHNNINAVSYNRNVLLTGEVRDERTRLEAQRLAGTVKGVRAVVNELVVGPASPLTGRANDTAITTNIKSRFLPSAEFSANHVKVVTEAGVVFLLGIVTRTEGHHAAEIARNSRGVRKVVKVFEYIGEKEAQALDARDNSDFAPSDFPPEAP